MRGAINEQIALLGILLAGLCIRFLYLYQAVDTPLLDVLLIDSEFYDRRAREIAAGDWLGDHPFFMNAFYPYFLAILYVVGGTEFWMVGLVQSVMGVGACALLYGLGRRLWDSRVGLLAAGLGAVYAPHIFYDGALLTAAPITLMNIAALYCFVRSTNGRRGWLWLGGMLLGLSATARPLALIYVGFLGCWYIVKMGWSGLSRWIGILLGCSLVVGLVILRNYAIGGEWGLTTSSAGMNFYVGNHPGANGIYSQVDFLNSAEPDLERAAFKLEAERRSGGPLGPGQVSHFWLREGLRFAVEQPWDYLRLLIRKGYLFCNGVEAQNNLSIYFAKDLIPLLRWCFVDWGLLAPLAAAGWIWLWRSRSTVLDLYVAAYFVGCLIFFVSSEYRLPVVPVICLYAARLIIAAISFLTAENYRNFGKVMMLSLLLALPINYRDAGAKQLTLKRVDYYNFATLYQRQGDWLRAERLFRQALRIDPSFAPARSGLARALFEQGKPSENSMADREGRRGMTLFRNGEYEAAILAFKGVIAMNGPQPQILNNIGLCYYRLDRSNDAIDNYLHALQLDSLYVRPRYNLGLVYLRDGDESSAYLSFERVLQLDQDNHKARFQQGVTLARMDRVAEAEVHWNILLARNPGNVRLRAKIDSVMAAL